MRLEVPLHKESDFALNCFEVLGEALSLLKQENGKWPDLIYFQGTLGREVLEFINNLGWEIGQFNPTLTLGPVNKIRIEFSKSVSQIEEIGKNFFDESFNGKTINSLIDGKTADKIAASYSNLSYTISREVKPYLEIKLVRKK